MTGVRTIARHRPSRPTWNVVHRSGCDARPGEEEEHSTLGISDFGASILVVSRRTYCPFIRERRAARLKRSIQPKIVAFRASVHFSLQSAASSEPKSAPSVDLHHDEVAMKQFMCTALIIGMATPGPALARSRGDATQKPDPRGSAVQGRSSRPAPGVGA
jgi:hypothetical protein